jgi:hypothetical protein
MPLCNLVALRQEFIDRWRTQIPALKDVVGVEDVSKDVLNEVVPKLNTPFLLVCLSDENLSPSTESDDGEIESGSSARLLEHDLAAILGTKNLLTKNAAVESALALRQDVKAAVRDWSPSQAFGSRVPNFKGVNRIGRHGAIVLHGLYFGQTVYES